MSRRRGKRRAGGIREAASAAGLVAFVALVGSCRGSESPGTKPSSSAVLRIGVGQTSATNPLSGLRQISQILTVENLARPGEDGRMQPWLAESWTASREGRSLTIKLRPGVKFHDGSRLDSDVVARVLPGALRTFMGPVFSDVERVRALGNGAVQIDFRGASPFLLESLEATFEGQSDGSAGTGPFMVVPNSATELRANAEYYLGRPAIDLIQVQSYASVRAAWADMLRDRLDMLWEVGTDALDSMTNSSTVSVFTFTRRYQYVIAFNPVSPVMRSREIRRALNKAIDRESLVRNALNTYGVASSGPIWPHYWALPADARKFEFDPRTAAETFGHVGRKATARARSIRFTCLVPTDSVNERIALEVKRQLVAVGVDMAVEETTRDQIVQRASNGQYDAALVEFVSGPTLLRPYIVWHSKALTNWGGFGNPTVDGAFDQVRSASSDEDYRTAVIGLQQAFMDDPPAIFLAWSVQSRAVSKRFAVQAEPGRDVLRTLRLWKPVTDTTQLNRN